MGNGQDALNFANMLVNLQQSSSISQISTILQEQSKITSVLAEATLAQKAQLDGIELSQKQILALQQQQLQMQRAEKLERELKSAIRNAYYSLKKKTEQVSSLEDVVSKYLLFSAMKAEMQVCNMPIEKLDSFQDKEFAENALAEFEARFDSTVKNLKDEEIEELSAFYESLQKYSILKSFDEEPYRNLRIIEENLQNEKSKLNSGPQQQLGPMRTYKYHYKKFAILFLLSLLVLIISAASDYKALPIIAFFAAVTGVVGFIVSFGKKIVVQLLNRKKIKVREDEEKIKIRATEIATELEKVQGEISKITDGPLSAVEISERDNFLEIEKRLITDFAGKHGDIKDLVLAMLETSQRR